MAAGTRTRLLAKSVCLLVKEWFVLCNVDVWCGCELRMENWMAVSRALGTSFAGSKPRGCSSLAG